MALDQARYQTVRARRLRRYRAWLESVAGRAMRRLAVLRTRSAAVDVAVIVSERDRASAGSLLAGALAFRFFAVLVPFVVVWVAVVGFSAENGNTEAIVRQVGLTGYIAASVAKSARLSTGANWLVFFVGLFALGWASLSAVRTLRAAFAIAWGMPVRRWGRGLAAALVLILMLHVVFAATLGANLLREHWAGGLAAVLFLAAVYFGMWLGASWLLPRASADWKSLIPGALLVGLGTQVLQLATIFLIWRVTRTSAFYGPLGLSIVILLWLYLIARLLIASAFLNAHMWERKTGLEPGVAGSVELRSSEDGPVWTAPAALPALAGEPGAELPSLAAHPAPFRPEGVHTFTMVAACADRPLERMETAVNDPTEDRPGESVAPEASGDAPAQEAGGGSGASDAADDRAADGTGAAAGSAEGPAEVETTQEAPATEIATAHGATPVSAPPRRPRRRLRAWVALGLVILAVVTSLVTSIGFWAHSLLFNTDKYVETVAPILKDRTVTNDLGRYIAVKAVHAVDLEMRLEDMLPPRMDFLAPSLADEMTTQLTKWTQKLLRTDQAYTLWVDINRFAHERLVAVLKGDSKVIQLHGDKVQLNTIPLMAMALDQLTELLPDVIAKNIPTIDTSLSPADQQAQLEAAIGIDIPDRYAQITLYEGNNVTMAQKAVHWFNILVWVILAISVALVAAALVVSPRKRRTLIQLGIGAVLVVVLTRLAINELTAALLSGAESEGPLTVVSTAVHEVVGSLTRYIMWLLAGGAVLGVIAYLAGLPKWVRKSYATAGRLMSSGSGVVSGAKAPAAAWISRNVDALRVGGVIVGVLVLLITTPGIGAAIAIVAVFAVYELLVSYFGRESQTSS